MPSVETMYPQGFRYQVEENNISQVLEGQIRPGHFNGMLTIVLKLLQCVKATRAYFGEKDYQQLLLVQGLVEEFLLRLKLFRARLSETQTACLKFQKFSFISRRFKHAAHFSRILKQNISIDEIKQQLIAHGF